MQNERATLLCTLLLTQRVVSRHQFPELEDDPALLEDVRTRLAQVGVTLVQQTGIPFLGVVVRDEYVSESVSNELGLDQRALALILRVWMRLVAPHIYADPAAPTDLRASTVTEEALEMELGDTWGKTTLRRYLSLLQRAKFLDRVYGVSHTYTAGPMLWLAIDHETLIQHLKRSAVPFTIDRFRREAEGVQAREEEEEN